MTERLNNNRTGRVEKVTGGKLKIKKLKKTKGNGRFTWLKSDRRLKPREANIALKSRFDDLTGLRAQKPKM